MILEFAGVLAAESFGDKLLHSFFQSVTTRSAGFCTVHIGSLATSTALLCILLMFIGASP